MALTFQDQEIFLDKIVRLYHAAVMTLPDGENVQVSFDWAESKFDQVNITGFVICFDYGEVSPMKRNKQEFFFDSFSSFELAMQELGQLIQEYQTTAQ